MMSSMQGNLNMTVSQSVKHVDALPKQLEDQINTKYFDIVIVILQ